MPAYDDAQGVTARFNILARINRDVGATFDVESFRARGALESRRLPNRALSGQCGRAKRVARDCGHRDSLRARPRIHTESSYKFTRAMIDGLRFLARAFVWSEPGTTSDAGSASTSPHCQVPAVNSGKSNLVSTCKRMLNHSLDFDEVRMPRLLSVNVGLPRHVMWNAETVRTAVWKSPVNERRMVHRLNVQGDAQANLVPVTGGEHRAVFVYQMDFSSLGKLFGPRRFCLRQFGENFTVEGLPTR